MQALAAYGEELGLGERQALAGQEAVREVVVNIADADLRRGEDDVVDKGLVEAGGDAGVLFVGPADVVPAGVDRDADRGEGDIAGPLGRGAGVLGRDAAVDIQADGDLLMTSSSLWTAAKHRIPLLIVMHNNQSYYNSEEHGIEVAKYRNRPVENAGIGTHVDDPAVDFAKMAESFGVHAEGPIERPADLRPALERALKFVKEKRLPALVDVISEPR